MSPGQRQAERRRADHLRDAAATVLDRDAPRPRYSMRDLRAFSTLRDIWRQGGAELPTQHPARTQLRQALDQLAIGCHRFEHQDKGAAYHAARDALSLSACALLLDDDQTHEQLAARIEDEAIPAVAGLMRRSARKRPQ